MTKSKFKNILIVNSGNSIGIGLAWLFAEAGHRLMLHAKDESIIPITKEITSKHKVQVGYSLAEIHETSQSNKLIAETEEKLGNVDCIVNLINMEYNAPIDEFPLEKWQLLIQHNLTTPFLLSKAA